MEKVIATDMKMRTRVGTGMGPTIRREMGTELGTGEEGGIMTGMATIVKIRNGTRMGTGKGIGTGKGSEMVGELGT